MPVNKHGGCDQDAPPLQLPIIQSHRAAASPMHVSPCSSYVPPEDMYSRRGSAQHADGAVFWQSSTGQR